jgi:hypothetical protein
MGVVDWIVKAQDRSKWQTFEDMVMNIQVP